MTDRSPSSTLPAGPSTLSKRRTGYALTTAFLTGLMLLVITDAIGENAVFGVDSTTERAESGDLGLAVTYGVVSRPALATPFDIEVHQPGGFDGPVRIAVDQEYLRMWDENGLVPAPSAETVMGPWVVWEFDPPIGETLLVSYDARIEPAAQQGRSGSVAVLDDNDAAVVQVDFTTRVWP
ncbi:MAG: hypothetical protein ABWZ52_00085 [Acidimicrobiales bacterium]